MAEYKDVYYADSSTAMSAGAISYAEAVSRGNRLEEIKLDSAVKANSVAERTSIFPTPVQGDSVFRTDTGTNIEQRYFELKTTTNPGGKNVLGWYTSTSAIQPIILTSVAKTGTGSTASINSLGELTFSSCTSVQVNSFYAAGRFRSYKIIGDMTFAASTTYPTWSLRDAGAPVTGINYYWAYEGVLSGASNGAVANGTTSVPLTFPSSTISKTSFELNLNSYLQYNVSLDGVMGFTCLSQSNNATNNSFMYAQSGHAKTNIVPDGFFLGTSAGTVGFSGSLRIYGIR